MEVHGFQINQVVLYDINHLYNMLIYIYIFVLYDIMLYYAIWYQSILLYQFTLKHINIRKTLLIHIH